MDWLRPPRTSLRLLYAHLSNSSIAISRSWSRLEFQCALHYHGAFLVDYTINFEKSVTMNIAIIGSGTIAGVHADAVRRAGGNVTVCASRTLKGARRLARQYGAAATTDAQGAMNDAAVDIVLIATPTATHSALIRQAAKAGKDIFCEKPLCRTVAQCRSAIGAVKKAKVKLFVGHVLRYAPEFELLREQIEEGAIGEPGFAKLYRSGIFPGGVKSWFADYEQSGGVTLDSMIHDLDWARYVFGEPRHIYCQTLQRLKPTRMDYAQATLRMKNGVIATLIGSWAHAEGFRVKTEICGMNGMLQYDSHETTLEQMMRSDMSGEKTIVLGSPLQKSPYQLEWEDFLGWIQEDRRPRVTPEDGLRAVEMATAAVKSATTGRRISL